MKTTIHWRKWPEEKPPDDRPEFLSEATYVVMEPSLRVSEVYYNTKIGFPTYVIRFALPGDIHHDAGGTDGGGQPVEVRPLEKEGA